MQRPIAISAALAALALLCAAPLLLEPRPVDWVALPTALAWGGRGLVVAALFAALAVQVRLFRPVTAAPVRLTLALAALAGLLVAVHWLMVDRQPLPAQWQRDLYLDILNHRADAPHQFRPAPYGLVRLLERLTGDWDFAVAVYRWFFLDLFLGASFLLARPFLDTHRTLVVPLLTAALYPCAVAYYWGQLTDPLSHALFVLSMLWIIDDRLGPLTLAVAIGVAAKETAVLQVPAYLACYWQRGGAAVGRTAVLGASAAAAFLACRLPLGWAPGYEKLNGTSGLMVAQNLGLVAPGEHGGAAPVYQNYLQPLLFFGPFLPAIIWRWTRIDPRLRGILLVLGPGVLASSLCFSWLYESRNYLPLVPLLATMALVRTETPPA
jgi:hypothetical protein